MTNVCPRCRSKDIEISQVMASAKCKLCNWQGPVADCLAVTRDGMVLEKVMERMVHRLSTHVGRGLARGVIDFSQEYGIRIRQQDLHKIVVKIVLLCLKTLHEELMALAPKSLKDKAEATSQLIAADDVTTPEPEPDLPMIMKEIDDGVINPSE